MEEFDGVVQYPAIDDPSHARQPIRITLGRLIPPASIQERLIDIDTYKIQITLDLRHILFSAAINTVGSDGLALENGVAPPAVAHSAKTIIEGLSSGFLQRLRRIIFGDKGSSCHGDADLDRLFCVLADRFHSLRMGQHTDPGQFGQRQILMLERCVCPLHITVHNKALRLIHGHPVFHPVGQRLHYNLGILRKQRDDGLAEPAAFFVNPHRQVPMENGDHRLDSVCNQFIHQIGIELQPFGVDFSFFRNHTGPGNRETVAFQSHLLH